MASTYSPSLRIQLIETGTENEAWGQPLDNNLGTIIEQAITGVNSISLTNLTSLTLSTANAAVDQARNAVLVFTGALSANCNVIAPSVKKVYVVSNQTTGGYNINVTVGSGANVAVANGTNQLVYCNGTAFKSAVDVNFINGNLDVSGSSTVGGNVTVGSNIVMGNALTATNGNLALRSTTSNIVNFQGTTGALIPPFGTTAQRPASPVVGMSRWNSDIGTYEVWNGTQWQNILNTTFSINYLLIAGGGGSGSAGDGGAGGGGGFVESSGTVNSFTSYTITVGAGGSSGSNGGNSTAFSTTAIGGGRGATSGGGGTSGGSGGGGWSGISANNPPGQGTSGQGNRGGFGFDTFPTSYGAGGGGAGDVGQGEQFNTNGGIGRQSSITGSSVYYAGGGVGTSGGSPGLGTIGRGGSGGGGSGANGTVIISYVNTSQRATGGTVTSYSAGGNTYWVHTFTTSGTFTTS